MRNTKIISIDKPGRDHGKSFLLTEMSASHAEKWAMRAWLTIAHASPHIPEEFLDGGWPALAMVSLTALSQANFAEIEPLMDEMFKCVQIMPDKAFPERVRPIMEEDIDEVETRVMLRKAIFELHAGPFVEGVRSKLASTPKKSRRTSKSTSTSQNGSGS